MGKVCEHQFFSLDPIFEPILTPPFESRLDLSQIPESVSVFTPIPFESKSIISQNQTSLLDKNVEEHDSVIIFQNWKLEEDKFLNKTIQSIILLLGRIREVTGGFLQDRHYPDWWQRLAQSDHHQNHHHEVIFLPSPFISSLYTFTMH